MIPVLNKKGLNVLINKINSAQLRIAAHYNFIEYLKYHDYSYFGINVKILGIPFPDMRRMLSLKEDESVGFDYVYVKFGMKYPLYKSLLIVIKKIIYIKPITFSMLQNINLDLKKIEK